MGILTQLINEHHQKQRDDKMAQIGAYKSVLGDTSSTPEAKEYALNQLMGMAPGGKKVGETLTPVFKKMLGIDKPAVGGDLNKVKGGAPDPTQAVSGPMSMLGQTAPTTTPQPTPSDSSVDLATPETITGRLAARPTPVPVPPPPVASMLAAEAPPAPPTPPPTPPPPVDPNTATVDAAVSALQPQKGSRPSRFYLTPEEIQAQQLKFTGQEADQKTQQAINLKTKLDELATTSDTAKRVQLVKEIKTNGGTDQQVLEAVYKVPKDTVYNWQRAFIDGPNNTKIAIRVDPRNPGNRVYEADGTPVPQSIVAVAAGPTAFNDPNAPPKFGEFAQLFNSYRGLGHDVEESKQFAAKAYLKRFGVALGKSEQDIAIKSALSGIGAGPGVDSTMATPTPITTPTPTVDSTGAQTTRTALTPGGGTKQVPVTPQGTRITAPLGTPEALAQANPNERFINMAKDALLINGRINTTGPAALGQQKGMEAYRKLTGLTNEQLSAAVKENATAVDQLKFLGLRSTAYDAIQSVLATHGDLYTKAVENVQNEIGMDGVPLVNKPIRDIMSSAGGSEAVTRLRIALAAIEREYGKMVAGGMTSNAMPPVSSQAEAAHIFSNGGQTLGMALASVDQIKMEAKKEKEALESTKQNLLTHMGTSLASRAQGGGGEAGGKEAPKEAWRTPKTKGLTIDKDTAKKYIQKYGSVAEGIKAAVADGWSK